MLISLDGSWGSEEGAGEDGVGQLKEWWGKHAPICWFVETFSMGLLISAIPAATNPHLKVGAQKCTGFEGGAGAVRRS